MFSLFLVYAMTGDFPPFLFYLCSKENMEIKIPFKINPYEEALVNVLSAVNSKFDSNTRYRTTITEKPSELSHAITGYATIEKFNPDNNTWEVDKISPPFTVKSDVIKDVDNAAAAKSMVKFIYFTTRAMGIDLGVSFETENIREIVEMYRPKKTWAQDMQDRGIDIIEFAKHNTRTELRKFFEGKGLLPIFNALNAVVKDKYKSEHPSCRMFREFIWGKKQANGARTVAQPRPAKRKPVEVEVIAATPVTEAPIVQQARSTKEVEAIVSALNKLGVTKSNYAERMPEMAAKYATPLFFAANCTQSELLLYGKPVSQD